jgi:hypothetical protein
MKKYLKPEMEVSKFDFKESIMDLLSGQTPDIGEGKFDGSWEKTPETSWDDVMSNN